MSRFPFYEKQFGDAIAALGPWDDQPQRSLASVGIGAALHMSDRFVWKQWARERLYETQAYLDLAAEEPSAEAARRELSDIANELVAFHGYASDGRAGRMITVLKRIEERSGRIRQLTCTQVAQKN